MFCTNLQRRRLHVERLNWTQFLNQSSSFFFLEIKDPSAPFALMVFKPWVTEWVECSSSCSSSLVFIYMTMVPLETAGAHVTGVVALWRCNKRGPGSLQKQIMRKGAQLQSWKIPFLSFFEVAENSCEGIKKETTTRRAESVCYHISKGHYVRCNCPFLILTWFLTSDPDMDSHSGTVQNQGLKTTATDD